MRADGHCYVRPGGPVPIRYLRVAAVRAAYRHSRVSVAAGANHIHMTAAAGDRSPGHPCYAIVGRICRAGKRSYPKPVNCRRVVPGPGYGIRTYGHRSCRDGADGYIVVSVITGRECGDVRPAAGQKYPAAICQECRRKRQGCDLIPSVFILVVSEYVRAGA